MLNYGYVAIKLKCFLQQIDTESEKKTFVSYFFPIEQDLCHH